VPLGRECRRLAEPPRQERAHGLHKPPEQLVEGAVVVNDPEISAASVRVSLSPSDCRSDPDRCGRPHCRHLE
jgi:hypothetical protein